MAPDPVPARLLVTRKRLSYREVRQIKRRFAATRRGTPYVLDDGMKWEYLPLKWHDEGAGL